jgi:Flp pilus assembly protein TadG
VRRARDTHSEDGGVLLMVVLWLPVLVLLLALVIDVGNWFEHKRHLQTQADAAALAAAGDFRIPCSDTPIVNQAMQYSGFSGQAFNQQVGGAQPRTHIMLNSATYYNQGSPVDGTVRTGGPCSAGMVDVKLTETDLPWYFGFGKVVKFVNAHARVEIKPLLTEKGALPVGVPDINPTSGRVVLINESNGSVISSQPLAQNGSANGLVYWDNSASPFSNITIPSASVGVRVILSGSSSTTCGDPLVSCYDLTDATHGMSHIRSWSTSTAFPYVQDAYLSPGTCGGTYNNGGYFNGGNCGVGLSADIFLGTANNTTNLTIGASLSTANNATTYTMTASGACTPAVAGCTHFVSSQNIPLGAPNGPVPVYLRWSKRVNGSNCSTTFVANSCWNAGSGGILTCSNGGNDPCQGNPIGGSFVQRSYGYADARSGPIKDLQVLEGNVAGSNSFQAGTQHTLTVKVGVLGSLSYASSVNDPIVSLRVVGGSQNQSLDCDPAISKLKDELAQGCAPQYTKNTGTACPSNISTLWGSAQPWSCVAVQTGSATNQVPAGMNHRILGSEKPATCTAPNHWSMFPNLPVGDPRIVPVFLTPFGSFDGSGNTTVPVTNFAFFYVTGWTGQGQGFSNPCQGNGDDPVPNNDAGYIVGHFIKYVQTINTNGGGPGFCDLSTGSLNTGACVAVLTQ